VVAPVGSVADSYDNAMAEAMNGTFKAEPIYRQTWRTRDQVELAIVGNVPPVEHETIYYRSINTPAPTGTRQTGLHTTRGTSHQSLRDRSPDTDPAVPSPIIDLTVRRIKRRPVLGGLINEYEAA
jgi:hypothetical protein